MRLALTIALLLALLVPATAAARSHDVPRGAKLHAAVGTLTISESRCQPGSSNCGHVKLEETFNAGPKPDTRPVAGRFGFPVGCRIRGDGRGQCSGESPTTFTTGPDGSAQLLSGASRIEPAKFAATRVMA